ncbi:cyclin-domain-containing protein, partial [Mucor lusitanicus]
MYNHHQQQHIHHHHQQQQQQQQQQHYQLMDTSNNNANTFTSDTIPYLPPPPPPASTAYTNSRNSHLPPPPPPPPHHQLQQQQQQQQIYHHPQQQQQQGYAVVLPEPVPSATDAQPTPPLSIPQLADFASTMVYLMWHARRPSVMALHDLSKLIQATHTDDHNPGHSRETANIANRTSTAFKKFCKQILQATQLSESVILLSLKYIAMLLQNNPSIQGADGSEYRLFTVALMLGNKFLDDNTFTNKTWSEVSGMKVTDLNIMELEFLEVLRFKLFIRNDEFERWKSALLLFRSQLQNADEAQKQEHQQQLLEETFKGI